MVFYPKNINDLITLQKEHPESLLVSGGTYLFNNYLDDSINPNLLPLISIKSIPEFQRLKRSEKFIEIGSAIDLNTLLDVGKNVLPKVLLEAIRKIASRELRNLASLAGNIMVKHRRMDLFPVLSILDAKVELRHGNKTRWLEINELVDSKGLINLKEGETATRFRIPMDSSSFFFYKKNTARTDHRKYHVSFSAIVKKEGDLIEDIRFALGDYSAHIFRSRTLESMLIGHRYPFSEKIEQNFIMELQDQLNGNERLSSLLKSKAAKIIPWYIANIE